MYNLLANKKINLIDLNYEQLRQLMISIKEHPFCADQIMCWIYKYYCIELDKMTNISKRTKNKLQTISYIKIPHFIRTQKSIDGTIKWAMQVENQVIETVYIPNTKKATLCISSQIGCILQCTFCATGAQGFIRNLFVSEIIGQVLQVFKYISTNTEFPSIKNIVIMGMGEPLLNFSNIVNVIKILLDKRAFKLSKQHITLSTSGIIPGINKLRKSRIDIRLAISLHAPNDNLRNKIMPINYRYNIANMLLAVKQYIQYSKANRGGVTIEYVMLAGINDSSKHARQLAKLLSKFPSKINLIPWNSFFGSTFSCSSDQKIFNFYKILTGKGLTTTIRNNRGKDINAACGQLSGQISITKKIEKIQIIF